MDKEIQFKPLSQGLGFHPFSDGLPYAPISKTKQAAQSAARAMGTGAVSAGAPSYAAALPAIAPAIKTAVRAFAKPEPTPAPVPEPMLEVKIRYGFLYVTKRILAFNIDVIFNILVSATALGAVLWKQKIQLDLLVHPGVIFVSILFFTVFSWALFNGSVNHRS